MRLTGERYTTARAVLAASTTARPSPRDVERHHDVPQPLHQGHTVTGPERVANALYEALNTDDLPAVQALLAKEAIGKVSDLVIANPELHGAEALFVHLRRRRALGDGSYRLDSWEFQDHPSPERFAMAMVRHSALFGGERLTTEALHVFRVEGDQVALFAASLPVGDIDGRWLALVA